MKKLSLEVGDKVIIREGLEVDKNYNAIGLVSGMDRFRGKEVTVTVIYDSEKFQIKEDYEAWYWSVDMIDIEKTLQLQNKFTKSDLKSGHVVETRGEGVFIVMINEFDSSGDYLFNQCDNSYMPLDEYGEDLQLLDRVYPLFEKSFDIRKVYQPLHMHSIKRVGTVVEDEDFNLVWERQEPKKMTLAEIEEELGYLVEIVE